MDMVKLIVILIKVWSITLMPCSYPILALILSKVSNKQKMLIKITAVR